MNRGAKRERLTTWAVTPDGERVRPGFEDEAGQPCAISLPVAVRVASMRTIPRMPRRALDKRFANRWSTSLMTGA